MHRALGALITLVAVAGIFGCGSTPTARQEPAASPSLMAGAPTPEPLGTRVFDSDLAALKFRLRVGPGATVEPVADWERFLVLKRRTGDAPGVTGVQSFELYDPAAQERIPLWTVSSDLQDVIWSQDGDWLATVRQGYSLPFPEWTLILRNLRTGESREVARGDESLTRAPSLDPVLPSGFAPTPSIAGGRVVWVETAIDPATSIPFHRVQAYDILSGTTKTLLRNEDARQQRIYFPAIGGNTLAWAYWESRQSPFQIFVQDLSTGRIAEITNPGKVYDVKLSGDGSFLAWSNPESTFVEDLHSGQRTEIAKGHLGVDFNGDYAFWATSVPDSRPRDGGYFDVKTGARGSVREPPQHRMNLARVLGSWFVWQDIPPEGVDQAYWYLVRLS